MRSEEVRKRISDTCKKNGVGKWKKGVPWNKGKVQPIETKLKISKSLKGRKMPYVSESNKKRIRTKESIEKFSKSLKASWASGKMKGNTGKKASEETLKKLRGRKVSEETKEKMRSYRGEKSWNYIPDRSLLKKSDRHKCPAYSEWRLNVYKRDGFKCKINNEDCNGRLEAHHILTFNKFPGLRYEVNNGITLCHYHHSECKNREEQFVERFNEMLGLPSIRLGIVPQIIEDKLLN